MQTQAAIQKFPGSPSTPPPTPSENTTSQDHLEPAGDVLDTSETKDPSSKQEVEKEEVKYYCQLKEQIAQMKNRLNFIEISKLKNKHKLENTQKKTSTFISVRSFAAEMEKKLEEKRLQEEAAAKELKDRVAEFNRQTSLMIQEKKDKIKREKLTQFEKAKQEKAEIRDKLKQAQEEQRLKVQQNIQKQKVRSANSIMRQSNHNLNDSMTKQMRTSSINNFKLNKGPPSQQKFYNVYGKRDEYGMVPVDDMKKELAQLAKQEATKIDELHKILEKSKSAVTKFDELTKNGRFCSQTEFDKKI